MEQSEYEAKKSKLIASLERPLGVFKFRIFMRSPDTYEVFRHQDPGVNVISFRRQSHDVYRVKIWHHVKGAIDFCFRLVKRDLSFSDPDEKNWKSGYEFVLNVGPAWCIDNYQAHYGVVTNEPDPTVKTILQAIIRATKQE
jgi:hypothetical protein